MNNMKNMFYFIINNCSLHIYSKSQDRKSQWATYPVTA